MADDAPASGAGLPPIPTHLYRYLADRDHANLFLQGKIWVSTLSHVRHCDETRADPEDSAHEYGFQGLGPDTPVEEQRTIRENAKTLGIGLGEGIAIGNFKMRGTLPEAYVFCSSCLSNDPRLLRVFGKHCIEISRPRAFFELLASAVQRHDRAASEVQFGPVHYEGRSFQGADRVVGLPGFASVQSLSFEQEWRILAPIREGTVRGFQTDIPQASQFLRLVRTD